MSRVGATPEVIYEDDVLLVVYKPAGMATQTKSVSQMDLETWVKNHRAKAGEEPYVGIIQRLDQPVEGVMVVAKTRGAADKLTRQLQDHSLGKHYYALITNPNFPTEGVLEDTLIKDAKAGMARVVDAKDSRGKKACLSYRIVGEQEGHRLVEVTLETGRFHQIRVQFASRKAPLLGDIKYGGEATRRPLCLCGYRTEFVHPVTGEACSYEIVPRGADFGCFFDA